MQSVNKCGTSENAPTDLPCPHLPVATWRASALSHNVNAATKINYTFLQGRLWLGLGPAQW